MAGGDLLLLMPPLRGDMGSFGRVMLRVCLGLRVFVAYLLYCADQVCSGKLFIY